MAVPHDMVIFSFMLFGKKHSTMDFHEHWLETSVTWGERVYS